MIEIKELIKVREYGNGYSYANANDYSLDSELYDGDQKWWEVFEDVNGDRFWAREVKK